MTLWANDLSARGLVIPRPAAWYAKPEVTFSDAIAAVRRQLWIEATFPTSRPDRDTVKIPKTFRDRLIEAACYPA